MRSRLRGKSKSQCRTTFKPKLVSLNLQMSKSSTWLDPSKRTIKMMAWLKSLRLKVKKMIRKVRSQRIIPKSRALRANQSSKTTTGMMLK